MATVVAHDPLEYRHLLSLVARKFASNQHDIEDLEQSGWPGLARACDRFDPDKGHSFEACAITAIRSAIIDWLRKHGGTVHVPAKQRAALKTQAEDELTPAQLDCRHAAERVLEARTIGDSTLEEGSLADLVFARPLTPRGTDDERWDLVVAAVNALPDLQRQAMCMRFGIDTDPLPDEAIAGELGCSIAAVRKAASDGLNDLKSQLTDTPTLHEEPLPMSSLNGFHAPATTATPTVTIENRRCPGCGHVYKNPHNKNPVCYYKECTAYRVGVQHPWKGKRKAKPVAVADKAKAKTKAPRAKPVKTAMPSPAPMPDPMAAMAAMTELSIMQAIAGLPRAAAVRVTAWAACHFGA